MNIFSAIYTEYSPVSREYTNNILFSKWIDCAISFYMWAISSVLELALDKRDVGRFKSFHRPPFFINAIALALYKSPCYLPLSFSYKF